MPAISAIIWPSVPALLASGRLGPRTLEGPLNPRRPAAESPTPASELAGFALSQRGAAGAAPAPDEVSGAALDFERVYLDHFHHVSRWARALGGLSADLDDLAQDVFVVVRRKLASFSGPSLPAWLYGITRKTVSDYRRRAWVRRLLTGVTRSFDPATFAAADGVDPAERMEARRILARVLDQMSEVRRSAFVLFEIEGYSGEEIAELEQVPVATVYTRLHHARKDFLRLTAEITGRDPDPEEPPP